MFLAELTSTEVRNLAPDCPVIIPVAALEQHGAHLPLFTDSMLLGEIIRRCELQFRNEVLVAPLQWLGNSEHHLDFPGTLSAAPRTYLNLLGELIDNFVHHGFRRIVFINGHGGNDVPGKQAIFEARQKFRGRSDLLLTFATYWLLTPNPQKDIPDLHQDQMGHACEWETSMILALRPDLVKGWKDAAPVEFGNGFDPASRAWVTQDRSKIGHIGFPHLATAEKGERLFELFTAGVTAFMRRVIAWDGRSWSG